MPMLLLLPSLLLLPLLLRKMMMLLLLSLGSLGSPRRRLSGFLANWRPGIWLGVGSWELGLV